MNFVVRQASLKDSGAVARLSTQLGYPSSPAQIRGRLKEVLKDEGHGLLVVETPHGFVGGFVHIYVRPDVVAGPEARIGALVVDEDHRRQGIGRLLVRIAEEWAQGRGCTSLRLNSNILRNDAKIFYERLGFEHLKTQRCFRKSWGRGKIS